MVFAKLFTDRLSLMPHKPTHVGPCHSRVL